MPPEDTYWSPYSGLDALCGNPLMIDLDDLVARGLLDAVDLPEKVPFGCPAARGVADIAWSKDRSHEKNALCGSPLMIDLDDLVTRGLLDAVDLPKKARFSGF